jgi:hypothetical protein
MELGKLSATAELTSPINGSVYATGRLGDRWAVSVVFKANQTYAQRAVVEAFLLKLNGGEHKVSLWDFARDAPRGTVNTSGVTVSTAAAQFADTITLAGMGATKTLLEGDWFRLVTATGNQLVMCTADVTSTAGGTATVSFTPRLRGAVAAASAVTLFAPTATFMLEPGQKLMSPRNPQGTCPEWGVNFVEVF